MASGMGARRILSRGGQNRMDWQKWYIFRRAKAQTKIFAIFWRFRCNLRVFDARAVGASENFRVFCTKTTYDVIIFKFHYTRLQNCKKLGRATFSKIASVFQARILIVPTFLTISMVLRMTNCVSLSRGDCVRVLSTTWQQPWPDTIRQRYVALSFASTKKCMAAIGGGTNSWYD